MASEDSAEYVAERPLPLLPIHVHGVGQLDDHRESHLCSVKTRIEEPDHSRELCEVRSTGGIPLALLQERNHPLRDQCSRQDGVDEDVRISRLRTDCPAPEVLLGHFEERAA